MLHARRTRDGRHCLTCRVTEPKHKMAEDGAMKHDIALCAAEPSAGEYESPCERIPSAFLPRLLTHIPTKIVVVCVFVVYIVFSISGAWQLKIGLKLENIVPKTSYLSDYIQARNNYYPNNGPVVQLIMTDSVPYEQVEFQQAIRQFLRDARNEPLMDSQYEVSWLKAYCDYLKTMRPLKRINKNDFIKILKNQFLRDHQEYVNDILFDPEGNDIISSRFYVCALHQNDSAQESAIMLSMRNLASDFEYPLISYCPKFVFAEHHVLVLKDTLLAVGVAIIGMLFIALMFIPHPISILCVAITMVSLVLGLFGFLHFWGLELSAFTRVQILLAVAFSVDYTLHISHSFLSAPGKRRNDRVVAALQHVGIPILNMSVTSLLGILMLAFAESYVSQTFFRSLLIVVILGIFHSMLVLPVLLSFFGPRRTSKPRMFIPISQAARCGGAHFMPPPSPKVCHKEASPDPGDLHESLSKKMGKISLEMVPIETVPEEDEEGLISSNEATSSTQVQDDWESTTTVDDSYVDATSVLEDPTLTMDHQGKLSPYSIDGHCSSSSGTTGSADTLVKNRLTPNELHIDIPDDGALSRPRSAKYRSSGRRKPRDKRLAEGRNLLGRLLTKTGKAIQGKGKKDNK